MHMYCTVKVYIPGDFRVELSQFMSVMRRTIAEEADITSLERVYLLSFWDKIIFETVYPLTFYRFLSFWTSIKSWYSELSNGVLISAFQWKLEELWVLEGSSEAEFLCIILLLSFVSIG